MSAGPLLLGVRHHGPGSARAVRAALDRHRPRAVLIEGPPEADGLVALAADPEMRPPVALLAHVADDPARAAFWPLAEFSPEWVAIRWALAHDVPVRFIDLPASHTLAMADGDAPPGPGDRTGPEPEADGSGHGGVPVTDGGPVHDGDGRGGPDGTGADDGCGACGGPDGTGADDGCGACGGPDGTGADDGCGAESRLRVDPLAVLAEAAGYDDPERWWEDVVEHRTAVGRPADGAGEPGDGPAPEGAAACAAFEALAEAMGALRETYEDGGHDRDPVREAHMRLRMREAGREFGDAYAVVCGAWHVPALTRRTTVTADRRLLKGLPKSKVELSWVPWTHRRLSRDSGYGAGITSPGWYGHLFDAPDRPVERWMTKVAGLLRAEDHPVSSAHVIEAVRLADTLAAMRGRPLAGLVETTDAIRAVMCEGSDVPLALVEDRLIVGDVLGRVPDSAPAVPLQRDLTSTQRRLRLKPEARDRECEFDLRKDTDARRSRLLHRLRLLGIDWGEPVRSRGGQGTFRETWRLRWEPELSVRVAEAGVWGTTVLAAATAKAGADAASAGSLAGVTSLAERCLLAGLPDALPVVMRVLADRAALDADVGHLAEALPALVRSARYGDVRGTDSAALAEVAAGLAERVFVGLQPACAGLDADGAAEMRGHLDSVHTAVGLLAEAASAEVASAEAASAEAASAEPASGEPVPAEPASAESASADATSAEPVPAEPVPVETAPAETAAVGAGAKAGAGAGAGAVEGEEGPVGRSSAEQAEQAKPAGLAGPAGPAGPVGSAAPGAGLRDRWAAVLRTLAGRDTVPGLIRGRAARLLLDDGRLAEDEAARLMGHALSPGTAPVQAAAWIEGFVGGGSGGGLLLVHDERLLGLVDAWLTGVPADAFTDVLPLLRRTFAAYESGVRRTLGELVRRGPAAPGAAGAEPDDGSGAGFGAGLDPGRSAAVLPTLSLLLGLDDGCSGADAGGSGTDHHGPGPDEGGAGHAGNGPGLGHHDRERNNCERNDGERDDNDLAGVAR
ncbi:DUF5682 family protein [Streptomyces sp. bgisy100]|uniref:DUF5682 family protein n=1 Tax=Streptomyces sp. bgisy100 TaxID=3413783 RepID=UPI003D739322